MGRVYNMMLELAGLSPPQHDADPGDELPAPTHAQFLALAGPSTRFRFSLTSA